MRRWDTVVVVLVAVAAAALLTWVPAHDPDLWWHLATGRAALATRSTLPVDPFSFSFAGAPWRYKDLVADVGLWTLFAHGGFGALLLLRLGCAAAIALGFCLVSARALPVVVGLGATMLLMPWADRPNLLSLALFPTVLALLQRRRFGWLVLVTWIWIVLHRAALLGYVLLGARAVDLALARLCARWPRLSIVAGEPPSTRTLEAAFGAAAVAPLVGLVNPSGRAAFTSAVDVAGSDMLRMYIAEWKQLGLVALVNWSGALATVTVLALTARLIIAVRRRQRAPVDGWHLALIALFLVLATRSVRWLPYLDLVCALALVLIVDEARLRTRSTARAATALAMVVLLTLAFVARRGAPFALGEDATLQPVGAVDFARAHGLDGPLVHSYEFGGYLVYRGVPVLVDGRLDQLYPPAFVATCIRAERRPSLLAKLPLDDVGWAIGSNGESRFTHRYLYRDPAWAEVYWSEAASVYVVRARHPELLPLAFGVIDPAAPELSAAEAVRSRDPARIAAARAELGRMVAASPTSLRANGALAIYFHLLGRTAERDTVMQLLRAVAPDHPAVRALEARFTSSPTTTAN
jgi:hypothetical protein